MEVKLNLDSQWVASLKKADSGASFDGTPTKSKKVHQSYLFFDS